MPWPFDREYMQLALFAGLVVGACAPLIGVFLVQRRLALMGDSVGHIAFAGVAGGVLADVWPVWTALAAAIVGSLVIERLRSRGTAQGDVALVLLLYGGIAGGVVLISAADRLDGSLLSYLFGQILTVKRSEMWLIAALGLVIVVTIGVCGRALFAMAVDEEWARVAGIPVGMLNSVLAVLTAVTVVVAMRVVGILLVAAMMVVPVAVAQVLARSQKGILAWSVGVGMASVVVGLGIARAEGLAPGGTIVLVAVAVFGIVATGERVLAKVTEDLHHTIATRLREVGQRYTEGRRVLVDRLAAAPQPVSIPELLDAPPRLPQSSAYRNLDVLEQAGVVHRITGSGDFARFELAEDLTDHHHHHLICVRCGSVEDFTAPSGLERTLGKAVLDIEQAHGFTADRHRLDLIGLCADCT